VKKLKDEKRMIEYDIDILPEESMEDFPEVDEEHEPETTDEITEGDFNRFKDSLPSGNDWE